MNIRFLRALICIAVAVEVAVPIAVAQVGPAANLLPSDVDRGSAGLVHQLAELNTRASVLMITAHPDDEDGGLLAYMSRGLGARVSLMTLTRGEGGQNAVSDDLYDALGILRTEELLASDRYYGVDQYWGSVIDYGFSKTREEAWDKWGRDRVLGDVVRVIRMTRPLILVSVFAGAPTDGHGNHQVAGEVTQEAFVAAGDPNKFPEQIREGLRPWSPLKVYAHVPFFAPTKEGIYDYATDQYVPVRFFDYVHQKWIEGKPTTDVGVQEGAWDAAAGLTYRQIGREGLAYQKTQGHGGMIPLPDRFVSEYHLYGSRVRVAQPAKSMFDSVNTSLDGIADLSSGADWLRQPLQEIAAKAQDAQAHYQPTHPDGIVPDLVAGLKATRKLLGTVRGKNMDDVAFELGVKEKQWESALSSALGLSFSAVVTPANGSRGGPFSGPDPTSIAAVPNESLVIEARLTSGTAESVTIESIALSSPHSQAWSFKTKTPAPAELAGPGMAAAQFQTTVPAAAAITRPYFTRPDEEQPYYNIDDPRWRTLSFAPYPLVATARVNYVGERITLQQYVQAIHREEPSAVQADPVLVEPAISISVSPRAGAVPLTSHAFHLSCDLHSNLKGEAKGSLRLELPSGWRSDPSAYSFNLAGDGASETVTFEVVPRNIQAKAYEIKAVAEYGGKSYGEGYRMIGYPGLRWYPYFRPATYNAVGVDVAVAPGLRMAFVPGTGDSVPGALHDLGVPVRILPAQDIATASLTDFDVILLGVRAYAVRPELRAANARLLEYVKNGGTLLVQYNLQNFDGSAGPYPFSLGPNAAKVVDETAPVEILSDSPILNWPNKITGSDFNGWQEERGHGFLQKWATEYQPLTETHDPDQPPQKGGLLLAHYGKGLYIYDAFALYRQLPDGVPGAFRILANLISAGKNPALKQ